MAESASLLDNIDENAPRIVEEQTHPDVRKTPASAYFRRAFKKLAITTVVISIVTIVLLIVTYIILKHAPLGNSYPWTWSAQDATKALAISLSAPLVMSGVSALINFPILLNVVVDVVLLACIIPRVIQFIVGIPNSEWCRPNRYPGQPVPGPDLISCLHWKSIITILMGIGSGFSLLISITYVLQLLLRGIAIYRTKLWRRPLSWTLPKEITINFSMKVVRQEGESAEGSEHGPVYLS